MKVRTLFISDIHLGSRACQASQLLEFLAAHDADKIYLIGDIIDGWRLRARWYWPASHQAVMERLVARAKDGVDVFYVLGNHDLFLAEKGILDGLDFTICREHVHVGVDGDRYVVVHGDQFDLVDGRARWMSRLGARAYEIAILCNGYLNALRRRFGLRYRPYAAQLKACIKAVMRFIEEFETSATEQSRRHGHRGIICGHIHHAALRDDFGFHYMNTGDWVESCSAIVEHTDGRFELLRWNDRKADKRQNAIRSTPVVIHIAKAGLALISAAVGGTLFFCRLVIASLRRALTVF